MKSKKIIYVILAVIICFVLFIVGREIFLRFVKDAEDTYPDITYLQNEVDFVAYVYGEETKWPEEFQYESVETLEEIDMDHDYVYLIINDIDSTIHFSEKNVKALVDFANNHSNFNFYYIGTEALPMFADNMDTSRSLDDDMSIGSQMLQGNRIVLYGIYTKEADQYRDVNEYLISDNVISSIAINIRQNEGE